MLGPLEHLGVSLPVTYDRKAPRFRQPPLTYK
jgi:hypothetical protein